VLHILVLPQNLWVKFRADSTRYGAAPVFLDTELG
jgi:hypothetical protein